MAPDKIADLHDRWARFRFSIIGPLLAAPPEAGGLRAAIEELARKAWKHPSSGEPVAFSPSTIERWYYAARGSADPVGALRDHSRQDLGGHPSLGLKAREALRAQHRQHPAWSYILHYDNLVAQAEGKPELGPLPSESVVRRWMKSQALFRQKRKRVLFTAGAARAQARLLEAEVRSYEAAYVHGLWHADFHTGSRPVLTRSGLWVPPRLFGALDDKSRLCCHAQWYLAEDAENFAHGFCQAAQKRRLPRALMTDNGGAETAAEIEQGLSDLGVIHETTLPHSPYQHGKQECFWSQVEGRLMGMVEGVKDLTLDLLNEATQAWVELEYNRKHHEEIGASPLTRFLEEKGVGRDSPSSDALRRAFRMKGTRTQRKSDGTITVEGVRFEVPNCYRHLETLSVRFARWDLSAIDLADARTGKVLCPLYPINKTQNAEGHRRPLNPIGEAAPPAIAPGPDPQGGIAPLLRNLMTAYAQTGLPPAYLPKEERP
jgi:transposase InsO family protein